MGERRLVYLGRAEAGDAGDGDGHTADAGSPRELVVEGNELAVGTAIPLRRTRSPWRDDRPHVRVIIGSDEHRADIRLDAHDIEPEHVRIYFPREGGGPADLRALEGGTTRVDGRPAPFLEWIPLRGGERIDIGGWAWRYEVDAT